MDLTVPIELYAGHGELRAELDKAVAAGGKLGEAAREVTEVLYPHLKKEEELAFPPLAILPYLTEGQVTTEMQEILPITARLRLELPNMLQEHKTIDIALDKLAAAAEGDSTWDCDCCIARFRSLSEYEERIVYPAALLVGRYVRLNLFE